MMKKIALYLFIISVAGAISFLSCQKEISCEGCSVNNKPPIAIAGVDEVITLPTDSILLNGSPSSDPDGMISDWLWTKISGPASFNIVRPSDSITKVKILALGTYQFELRITDNGGLSAKDTIQITVKDQSTNNRPPVANAGPDQTITLPTNSVIIDGNGSTDPDNNITTYEWKKISGPSSFTFSNAGVAQTQATSLVQGVYEFELKVTDAGGLNDKDTLQITVNPEINTSSVNIYVAGGGAEGPKYWKNGQAVSLNGSPNIFATSIAVAGSDVHVTGGQLGLFWYEESGVYWKNGQPVFTIEPGYLSSLAVAGSDVYVTGYEYGPLTAKSWKNGQVMSLTNGTSQAYAYGITVAGSDVYVAGEEGGLAKYWKNGQEVLLPNGSYARSIAVVGTDVYVAGNNGTVAKYWKNGQEFPLTNGSTTAYANSITVVGSDVYVAGWEGDYYSPVAKYWKNGQEVSLGTSPSFAWSISIFGTDVYVAGGIGTWSSSVATYWKNGQAISLPNGSRAMSIVVIN